MSGESAGGRKSGLRIDVPVSWQNAVWWINLDAYGRYIYIAGLMWSQSQGMDGQVPRGAVRFLDDDPDRARQALDTICDVTGRMKRTPDGWEFLDWSGLQEQTSAEQIERYRARLRDNQAASRRRKAQPVIDDATDDVTADVGKATKGQATKGQATKGQATKGQATKGQATKGQATKGQATKGQATTRDVSAEGSDVCPGGRSHVHDDNGRCLRPGCPSNKAGPA